MSNSNKPTYISRVHLKGYKSIRDLSIDLLPGLNIIIGPNGSGKTNFLTFLEDKFKDIDESNSTGQIEFIEGETVVKLDYSSKKSLFDADTTSTERTFGDVVNDSLRQPFLFKYGIPEKILGIDEVGFMSLDAKTKQATIKFSTNYLENDAAKIFADKLLKGVKISAKAIESALETNKKLAENLSNYTPIKGFRVKQGFPITHKPNAINLDYLIFEFFVNNEWLSWAYLSDGTKRLFHLIAKMSVIQNPIILIEEPELGIHPNQLRQLMRFLLKEAENKQIVITTHAPQVLNILDEDELGRIILTEFSPKNGTIMRHLSAEQIAQSRDYMTSEGLFLSDYWLYSNLLEKETAQ
jgi:AAA15 family ATPase/GTPase